MAPIALQLYTLRDQASEDLTGALKRIAEIGYVGIETAGLYEKDPNDIGKIIRDLGLTVCCSHIDLPTAENIAQIAQTAGILGNERIVSMFGPEHYASPELCRVSIDKFNQAAKLAKEHGLKLGNHNHWWEFERLDGELIFDLLMDECPDLFAEIDVYWAAHAGFDPAKVVADHASRAPLLHIKDGMLDKEPTHVAVGSGVLDIPAIIGAADPDVLEWLIVELDSFEEDMWQAVEMSYEYLTSNGLARGAK